MLDSSPAGVRTLPDRMSVARSSLEYLWIESVPLCHEVTSELGLQDNVQAETVYRQEKLGFSVGRGLDYVATKDYDQFLKTNLDIVKFVCKELWIMLFGKPIDTLKTNHRDTYFLSDSSFEMCRRMSTNLSPEKTSELAAPFLWFPTGMIRGFLHGMGIESRVNFDASELPMVDFSIVTYEN